MRYALRNRPKPRASRAAPCITCRARCRPPISNSCASWTNCIWSFLSRGRGCCAVSWLPRGARPAAGMSKTLMLRMGIEALYRRPRTTKPEPGHKIYPYLLRGMEVVRPNQVWAMDITYIPMAKGFVYLAAVLDWFSRRVLSWRVSITMEASFCVETLEDALAEHGKPEIFNTDQGSPVHGRGLHRRAHQQRHRDQHGRQGRLAGQRVRRAALAQREIRGGLSARLRQRAGRTRLDRAVSRSLQSPPPAFEP